MSRKPASKSTGQVVVLDHDSKILAGNALGDPHVRVANVKRRRAQCVARVAEASPSRGCIDELRDLEQLGGDILPRTDFLLQLAAPRAESIGPRLDRVDPPPSPVDLETANPLVGVLLVVHGDGAPLRILGSAVTDASGEKIVTIFQDVGTNLEGITNHAFDGIPACVELWPYTFDHHGRRRASRRHFGRASSDGG